ncbi:MAG: hypothetical protein Fur0018_04480 [Anaerolineales bacterium]
MPAVLFVCTANQIRSPFAAALCKQKLHARGAEFSHWRVGSAGAWTEPGYPVMPGVLETAQRWGLDLSAHRSQPVRWSVLRRCDLVLTMESGHKEALQVEFPQIAGRVFLLSEMAGPPFDVRDPAGRSLRTLEDTFTLIDDLLTRGLPEIIRRAALSSAP